MSIWITMNTSYRFPRIYCWFNYKASRWHRLEANQPPSVWLLWSNHMTCTIHQLLATVYHYPEFHCLDLSTRLTAPCQTRSAYVVKDTLSVCSNSSSYLCQFREAPWSDWEVAMCCSMNKLGDRCGLVTWDLIYQLTSPGVGSQMTISFSAQGWSHVGVNQPIRSQGYRVLGQAYQCVQGG